AVEREPVVRVFALDVLSPDEVAELTGADADLAAALHRETDGNPFFTSELFRHLEETGAELGTAGVPTALRGVVLRRVAQLGDDARSALIAASVVGQEF